MLATLQSAGCSQHPAVPLPSARPPNPACTPREEQDSPPGSPAGVSSLPQAAGKARAQGTDPQPPRTAALIAEDARSPIACWGFRAPREPPRATDSLTKSPHRRHSTTQSFTRVRGHSLARLVLITGTLQTTTTARTPKGQDTSPREHKPPTATRSGCRSVTDMRQRQFTWSHSGGLTPAGHTVDTNTASHSFT